MDRLSKEQIAEFRDAFSLFDKDQDGTIDASELGTVMRSLGQNPANDEVKAMIAEMDADGSGSIDFEEFVEMMVERMACQYDDHDIREAFKVFDEENTGTIDVGELAEIVRHLGDKLTDEEVQQMMVDTEGCSVNGRVNYDKFIKLITE